MRRCLSFLAVVGLVVLIVWGCGDRFEQAQTPARKGARKVGEEEEFRFATKGRRNPFTTFSPVDRPVQNVFLSDDLPRAKAMLTDIASEYRRLRDNPSAIVKTRLADRIAKLDQFLGRPCDDDEVKVYAAELRRRARNYRTLMEDTLRSYDMERYILLAEACLEEMSKLAAAGKTSEVYATLRKFEESIGLAKAHLPADPRLAGRAMDRIAALSAGARGPVVGGGIKAAEHALDQMQRNYGLGKLDAVLTDYHVASVQIARLSEMTASDKTGELRARVARLARRAKEIHGQAQIGIARSQLAAAKAILRETQSSFLADDLDSAVESAEEARQVLKAVAAPHPEIEQERRGLMDQASGWIRRVGLRRDFLSHPPVIAGVGLEPGNSVLLANNKVVQEGDYLDSVTRVKTIATRYVVFTYKGEDITLEIGF